MFSAPFCSSSVVYNCTESLWFYRWIVSVGVFLVVIWQVPDHDQHDTKETEKCNYIIQI